MDEERYLHTQRMILWEEVKGKLNAISHLYYPTYDGTGKEVDNGFERASDCIDAFIKQVEDNGVFE